MYVHTYIYIYESDTFASQDLDYMRIHTHIYIHIYACIHIWIRYLASQDLDGRSRGRVQPFRIPVCVCVCACVCVRVCVHACVHVHMFMCACVLLYGHECMYAFAKLDGPAEQQQSPTSSFTAYYVSPSLHVCLSLCLSVCMSVCLCVCVCVCVCACACVSIIGAHTRSASLCCSSDSCSATWSHTKDSSSDTVRIIERRSLSYLCDNTYGCVYVFTCAYVRMHVFTYICAYVYTYKKRYTYYI